MNIGAMSVGADRPLDARSILLAEDEVLIAMDLAAILEEAGARVHHARNLTESLRLAETRAFDAAILDVNLGRSETCAPVAELLQARGALRAAFGRHGATGRGRLRPLRAAGQEAERA